MHPRTLLATLPLTTLACFEVPTLDPYEPAPPDLEFCVVPDGHAYVSKKLQECNWAQSVEGALDTAHFSFLHNVITTDETEAKTLMRGAASSAATVGRVAAGSIGR